MKSDLMAKIGLSVSAVSLVINLLLILYLTCWWFPPLGYTSVGRAYLENAHCYYDSDCLDDCHASYNYAVEYACYRSTCYCKYRSFLNSKSLLI